MTEQPSQQNPFKPKIWIVSQKLGVNSEPWIERQLERFSEIEPILVYWSLENLTPVLSKLKRYQLEGNKEPESFLKKWKNRLLNLSSRNFCSPHGAEKTSLEELFESKKPSAILCHFGHIALRILPIALKHNIPIVVHFHGLDLSSSLNNRWYRWSLKKHLPSFTSIVVVGEMQKDWILKESLPPEKVHLIPCGVPTEEFTPLPRTPSTKIRFVTVSRLVPWKGINFCIEAFSKIVKEHPSAQLEIIGDGPQLAELQNQAETLGIEQNVIFLGSTSPNEVRNRLQHSDVFLQHSINYSNGWYEGFGVSVTEASAMELPVIVSRCGGIPDQVVDGETGYIIEQQDVEALSEAMKSLIENPDLRFQLGKNGRIRAKTHFDTTRQVKKLEAVLLKRQNIS